MWQRELSCVLEAERIGRGKFISWRLPLFPEMNVKSFDTSHSRFGTNLPVEVLEGRPEVYLFVLIGLVEFPFSSEGPGNSSVFPSPSIPLKCFMKCRALEGIYSFTSLGVWKFLL